MAPFAETPILSTYSRPTIEVTKEPDLLDGWWTSDSLFSLERRAIFSKTWIPIAHRGRFNKPGDYISFELAGFPIIIILGKDRITRAFHNVCRHRAYTITKKPAGSSLVLGCRYHGWSYDTKGSLVKAPQFDGLDGFDKTQNGLFKIRTCTDRGGFVHINLDAGVELELPDCEKVVKFANEYGITAGGKWLAGWESGGGFNWKTVGASDRTGIGTLSTTNRNMSILERLLSLFRGASFDISGVQLLFLEPVTTVFVFPKANLWASAVCLPLSASESTVKVDMYAFANATISDEEFHILKSYFASYANMLEASYTNMKGIKPEADVPQLPMLKAHLKLERLVGHGVFPTRKEEGRSESFCRAEKICKDLDQVVKLARVDSGRGDLDW